MTARTLEDKIRESGGPVPMLRSSSAAAYPFPIRPEYTNWRDEQASWKQTAVLFDQSHHMTELHLQGPDVKRLLSDVAVNSFATFGRNKAKQIVAVTPDGDLIGDAILFGLDEQEYSVVGAPTLSNWIAFNAEAGGYDVELRRDERTVANPAGRRLFRYQLQGPNALDIVTAASNGSLPAIKFFNIGEFTVAGHDVRALNHTMTGIPGQELTGLELWGPIEQGPDVLDALLRAGADFGLAQGGAIAYSTTALESGWIGLTVPALYSGDEMRPYRQYLPATGYEATASISGSFASDKIEDYYPTPWDLGYGRVVKFDHDFIGSDALRRRADEPHRRKVWLRWNDDDVARIFSESLFGGDRRARYLQVPYAVYGTFQCDEVRRGDRLVGISNRTGYTVNVGHWSSLAMLDEQDAIDGTEVTVVWGEPAGGVAKANVERHVQTEVRATVSTSALA